ncbi:MAG: AEC family transporter [Bacillota bacterium]|nr:AEC family transporter [Bacillota bacterium]
MGISEILNSVLSIFVMILPGFALRRMKLLDQKHIGGLTTLVANVFLPCMVIDAMQMPFSREVWENCLTVMKVVLYALVIALLLTWLMVKLVKVSRNQLGVLFFMLLFSNTGFMGMPLLNALWGQEALFYAAILELATDIFMFTIGIAAIQYSAGEKARLSFRMLLTPGLFSVIVGLVLFLNNWTLPGFLGDGVELLGSATSATAMVIVGAMLGGMSLKQLLGDRKIYAVTFVRLFLVPAAVFVLLRLIMGDFSLVANSMVVLFSMPAAALSAILAEKYGADSEFGTKGVMLSTVLSVLTIPLWTLLLTL